MTQRGEVVSGGLLGSALFACLWLAPTGAHAASKCPTGMVQSEGTCCEPGSEYVPSKNTCMTVRPERRCLAGHLDDCVQAGRELEREGKVGAGYAMELYRFACDEGHAPACRGLGSMYREGRGTDKDEQRGRMLYEQACDGGDAPACTQVAQWLLETPAHVAEALPLLVQACHRGDAQACAVYAVQLAKDSRQHPEQAQFLELACQGGVGSACRVLLEVERGERNISPARERDLLERACAAADAEGCTQLGDAFREGLIEPQSSADAAKRYRLACDAGHLGGCMRLAELTVEGDGVLRDLSRAAELYTRMCTAGVAQACEQKARVESQRRREPRNASSAR